MAVAVIFGPQGRLGKAFSERLQRDGFEVIGIGPDDDTQAAYVEGAHVFDCSLVDPYEQFQTSVDLMRELCGLVATIFMPTSHHAWTMEGFNTEYGRCKSAIHAMAALYDGHEGTRVVVNPIGYFPGDGVAPDHSDPLIDLLVDGETLYSRVMAKLGIDIPRRTTAH